MSELDDFFNMDKADVPEESGAPEPVPDKPSTPIDTLRAVVKVLKEAARWTDGAARADIERARERIEKILEDSA